MSTRDKNDSLESRLKDRLWVQTASEYIKHQSSLKMKILIPGAEAAKAEKLVERNGVATGTGVRGSVQKVGMGIHGFVENRGTETRRNRDNCMIYEGDEKGRYSVCNVYRWMELTKKIQKFGNVRLC
jgi:hypothetical protein